MGYGVKFEHEAETESFICLIINEKEIFRNDDYQHNRNMRNLEENQQKAINAVEEFLNVTKTA